MWAVLSDIHGNLEALDAVLAGAARHHVSHVFCLGDLVGYGPNPVECVGRAFDWDVTVLGDHDQNALFEPVGFCLINELVASALWSQSQLQRHGTERHWQFLATIPQSHRHGDYLLVHGSPRNPVNEYHFPEEIYNTRKMTRI